MLYWQYATSSICKHHVTPTTYYTRVRVEALWVSDDFSRDPFSHMKYCLQYSKGIVDPATWTISTSIKPELTKPSNIGAASHTMIDRVVFGILNSTLQKIACYSHHRIDVTVSFSITLLTNCIAIFPSLTDTCGLQNNLLPAPYSWISSTTWLKSLVSKALSTDT